MSVPRIRCATAPARDAVSDVALSPSSVQMASFWTSDRIARQSRPTSSAWNVLAYGLRTWSVRDPADLDAAMRAAIACDGPTLVDVISQPLEESAVPVSRWMG